MFGPVCIWLLVPGLVFCAEGNTTTVFGMNLKVSPADSATWIERQLVFPDSTSAVTVCFSVQLHFMVFNRICLMGLGSNVAFIVMEDHLSLMQGTNFYMSKRAIEPFKWTHICIEFGQNPSFYIDAEKMKTGNAASGPKDQTGFQIPKTNQLTVNLPFDMFADGTVGSFAGYATLPRVYLRKLTGEEVTALALGKEITDEYLPGDLWEVIGPDYQVITNITRIGSEILYGRLDQSSTINRAFEVRKVKSYKVYMPRYDMEYTISSGLFTYDYALSVCNNMKGLLPSIEDPDFNRTVTEILEDNPKLQLYTWERRNSSSPNCPGIVYTSDNPEIQRFSMNCMERTVYLICKVPRNLTFELRDDEFPDFEEKFYVDTSETLVRVVSLEGMTISIDATSLKDTFIRFKNVLKNETIAKTWVDESSHVLGRREWTFEGTNLTKMLVLTACSKNEFTCNHGGCLDLYMRCNGMDDCGDDSDEKCNLMKEMSASYREDRPHRLETPLALELEIYKVDNVDVDLSHMKVELRINTTWRDNRVTLVQLSNNSFDNEIRDAIWAPKFWFSNGLFEDNLDYAERENAIHRIISTRTGEGEPNVIGSYEGYEYNGEEDANITSIETISASFDCDFDLYYYPFDTHTCQVELRLKQTGAHKAYFHTQQIFIKRSNFTLPLFTTQPVCHTIGKGSVNKTDAVVIHTMLNRRYGAYILNTFLPCAILSVIGSLTQFFEYDNFSDRIMVTLSCLIVVASLFSTVASNAPSSAQPKVIDIFFFVAMVRLFICFLHHTILCLLQCCRKKREEKKKQKMFENPQESVGKNILAVLPNDLDVPGAALYLPPPMDVVPVNAWSNKNLRTASSFKDRSEDRIFNVLSIIFGYILDVAFYAWFFYHIAVHNVSAIVEYENSCHA